MRATVERTKLLALAALVVPLAFAVVGACLAVVLSVCVAYLLVGIYAVTGFHMSTCVPAPRSSGASLMRARQLDPVHLESHADAVHHPRVRTRGAPLTRC